MVCDARGAPRAAGPGWPVVGPPAPAAMLLLLVALLATALTTAGRVALSSTEPLTADAEADYCGRKCSTSDNCSDSVLPGACIVCFADGTCGGCDCSCGGECTNSSQCTGECSVCFPALSAGKGKCGVACGQHCTEDWHCLSSCGNCTAGFCRKAGAAKTDDGDLPSVMAPPTDLSCGAGKPGGNCACCASMCAACGGSGCADDCCTGQVLALNRSCSDHPPPCTRHGCAAADKVGPLPRLELGEVIVSGISSGADLAVQLQVAFSDLIAGAGIFAGQAYHCAVQRFPLDNLTHPSPSVPWCDGCPTGTSLGYDHCKRNPEVASNVSLLVEYAKRQAAAGTVAPLDTLATRRVFLYRGTRDHTYNKGAVQATAEFFLAFLPAKSVHFEKEVQSAHLVPTIDKYLCWWEEWQGPDNCTFDGAGHVLRWVHGEQALDGGRENNTAPETLYSKYMRDFDQTLYFPGASSNTSGGSSTLMASSGKVFVPPACVEPGASCRAHFFFHGCDVVDTFDVFSEYSGFNEWAMQNRFVIVYPKMGTNGKIQQMKDGCWDGYGDTGRDYDLRSGPQMATIASMIKGLGRPALAMKSDDPPPSASAMSPPLRPMLHIDWRRLPDFPKQGPVSPSGLEASNGGWVDDDCVVAAFGYPAGGAAAFQNTAWLLNTSSAAGASNNWTRLPDAPVCGRQDVGAAVIDGAIFFVGGFSYSAPFTYNDTLKLSRAANGSWEWQVLPDFPYPVDSYSGVVAVGTKLYLMGGAVYTAAKGAAGFYVNQTGTRLYSLDTADPAGGWVPLPSVPGSPRWVQSVSSVGLDIVVIGGATGANPSHAVTTVVDNWKYSTDKQTWSRLADM